MIVRLSAVVLTSFILTGSILAQGNKPEQPMVVPPLPAARIGVGVPLIADPLRLTDFAGMAPRADLRDKLGHVDDFIQQNPHDGKPGTEKTEVWMGHTKTALYFVFICFDRQPGQIRGHLARRENILMDDNVSVLLDTFEDRRKGILFSVNPAGVQADATWTENNQPDYSYDQVWDSEGRVTREGWMALIAIPFRSIRFRPLEANWGVVFMRNLPRNSESDFWPRVAANISGVLSQEGALKGMEGLTGSHNFQLNPYVLGQNERTLINIDPLNPYFSQRRLEGTAGGEVKAILRDSIVLDGTINPDFSTVESDQPQFTVNQRYPVYFPELRPFFLENANYFITPLTLVYTRNIVHPEYGARVTGKVHNTNLGLFTIDDREPGETVAPGDPLHLKRAMIAVGRVSQDFGKGSSIGAVYTDDEFGQGWNRIGGFDFTARVNNAWTVMGQMVESSTMGDRDSGTPPAYAAGPAADVQLQRSGHSFNMFSEYEDISAGFQTQLGFLQTSNIRSDHTHLTYQWFPKKSWVQSYGLEENLNLAWDHNENRVYHYTTVDPFLLLAHNTVIAPLFGENSDTLGPQNGYGFPSNHNFTENFIGFVSRGEPVPQLNYNLVTIRGGNVNYNPVAGSLPFLLNQQTVQLLFTLQPLRPLTADNTYLLDRDFAVSNGAFVYESQTFRTKLNYQFTRALSARVIVEYDSTLANPAETSLLRSSKQIGSQALLTWLPHPGTAVYVGYNNDLQNIDRTLCYRLPGGGCDPDNSTIPRGPGYLNDGKQIFVKGSYLFRF
ncbi:MAG TPA: carbohydrate binding family 9 domain-containing protein [Terracidiphilus sp.]|nr:carbohydrate binding family 9 domain-containing protein [Terracidiphilus sp.]